MVASSDLAFDSDPAWSIEDVAADPQRDCSSEARFAVSNGFLGALPGRTYVAGLFDTTADGSVISGLVPGPDWLKLRISANLAEAGDDAFEMVPLRLVLDVRHGAVATECITPTGTAHVFRVRKLHFVSLADRAVGIQRVEITLQEGEIEMTLEAGFDGNQAGLVLESLEQNVAIWHTERSAKRLGFAVAASLTIDGVAVAVTTAGALHWSWRSNLRGGQSMIFERFVAFERGDRSGHVGGVASDIVVATQSLGFQAALDKHHAAWESRWYESDVVIEGDAAAARAMRFAIYALNSAAVPTDERVSIGARALTGEDYHGHVFWDTEIYLLPFYIMTWPEAARALLMYRFHTLDAARAKAAGRGWRGALYAWESADTGAETTPPYVPGTRGERVPVLSADQEQHISADVAYAVWQYWLATDDEIFLVEAGAEILLETARFWASRAEVEGDGFRHIRGVMGPDEYHANIDDSAFTNVMARWNVCRAIDAVAILKLRRPDAWIRLSERLGLTAGEVERWHIVAQSMYVGLDRKTGLYEQFAGYFDLEDIDVNAYAGRSAQIDVVLGAERTQRSQIVKQADIVALIALLPDECADASVAANFAYYEPRCANGSSLSGAMHALVAARLGQETTALRYFREMGSIDLRETRAAISGGVHIAAQGGLWLAAVFGFSGFTLREDGVSFDPHVPQCWGRLIYRIRWRGRGLRVAIDTAAHVLEVTLEDGAAMACFVRGLRHELESASTFSITLAGF